LPIPRKTRRLALFAAAAALFLTACPSEHGPRTAFNGSEALGFVKTQLDFGTRVPGTPPHEKCGDWITSQMKQFADTVIEQRWTHVTAAGDTLPLRNILARFRPNATQRVLYLTHWDTRPVSDGAKDPAERKLPMPGANDGASGVALFVELARVLHRTPPNVGVDLLFVDGEDYGTFVPDQVDVLLGSKYFAQHLPSPDYQPLYGVLFDMIGDRDLDIYEEGNSLEHSPEVVSLVWRKAADLGYAKYFIPSPGGAVIDDHLPLIDVGLHVIDVLDIDYPYHHTPQDTFDKVSAQSLQIVGDVATALVTGTDN